MNKLLLQLLICSILCAGKMYAQNLTSNELGVSVQMSTPLTRLPIQTVPRVGLAGSFSYVYPMQEHAEWILGVQMMWSSYGIHFLNQENGHFENATVNNVTIKIPLNCRVYFAESRHYFLEFGLFGAAETYSSIQGRYVPNPGFGEVNENRKERLSQRVSIGSSIGVGKRFRLDNADLYGIVKYSIATSRNFFEGYGPESEPINYGCYPEIQVSYRF